MKLWCLAAGFACRSEVKTRKVIVAGYFNISSSRYLELNTDILLKLNCLMAGVFRVSFNTSNNNPILSGLVF